MLKFAQSDFKIKSKVEYKRTPINQTRHQLSFDIQSLKCLIKIINMKFIVIFAAIVAAVAGQWAEYQYGAMLGSSYGSPASAYKAPSYSAPSYSAKPSYAPSYAGPATSYTYPSPAPPGKF
jgi:hypothetical protein